MADLVPTQRTELEPVVDRFSTGLTHYLDHPFEKSGPGHRCDFSEEFVAQFAKWLKANFKVSVDGPPCQPHPELKLLRCPA